MMKRSVLIMLALAVGAGTVFAQALENTKTAPPLKFYRLDFVVKEVEGGKVLNSRAYSMTAAANATETASIRAGTRIAIPTSVAPNNMTQFNYAEVGVNLDCRSIKETGSGLSLFVSAEISSLPETRESSPGESRIAAPPAVRQNRWSSPVIVPLRRPTLIYSSDDPASKRKMQLELTATPIAE